MNAIAYTRHAQFTGKIEHHTGVYSKKMMNKYPGLVIIHPIINNVLMRGLCHTNAENISAIEINTPIDGATGKPVIL